MRALLRLTLIALLVLTSQSLAAARGQSRIAGEMVLCAGGELITIHVDDQGQPIDRMVICPDMALGLMAAIAMTAPPPILAESLVILSRPAPAPHGAGRAAPVAQARDPPLSRTV